MTKQITRTEVPMEVKELHNTIGILSNEVSRLQEEKVQLETTIEGHKGNLQKYREQELILNGLLAHIESTKLISAKATEDMNEIILKKNTLLQESEYLNSIVEKKKQYVSDIEKMKNSVVILQNEMADFTNQHSENKKKSALELSDMKQKVRDLHTSFTEIVNKM